MASQSRYTPLSSSEEEEEGDSTLTSVKLIIRFASSLPDCSLPIPEPHITSVATLKQKIRAQLPPEHVDAGIRLIAGGRILEAKQSIAEALRLPTDIPPARPTSTGKGKEKARSNPPRTIYIHAALSTPLSPTSLAAEADLALLPAESLFLPPAIHTHPSASSSAATSAPSLGFDRLSGFSPADISSLRGQFRAQIAARLTPDTMPNDAVLRALEERWLDGGNNNNTAPSASSTDAATGIGEEDDNAAALDDALWGAVIGFFWPLGVLAWGLREEGVWSRRRQLGVLVGVVTNLGFGVLKFLN